MKLADVYKNKSTNELIQIDSFATHIGSFGSMVIVFRHLEKHNEFEVGSCPSFNGYGSKEEIEEKYELLVAQEDLNKYSDWNDIFKLVEK